MITSSASEPGGDILGQGVSVWREGEVSERSHVHQRAELFPVGLGAPLEQGKVWVPSRSQNFVELGEEFFGDGRLDLLSHVLSPEWL